MTEIAGVAVHDREWTVDQFRLMHETGLLDPEDRVELIEGHVVDMNAVGPVHAYEVARIARLLHQWTGAVTHRIDVQSGLLLSARSYLEPDIAVLRPSDDGYRARQVTAHDALLVVEVADITLRRDRSVKLPLYAQARVPELWIVDVVSQTVETYAEPAGGTYGRRVAVGRGSGPISTDLAGWVVTPDAIFD